jgi:low temperature requirement protein LtrA
LSRLSPRDGSEQPTATVELLFDLAYVFAVTSSRTGGHLAERFQSFIIITLGESIVVSATASSGG